MDLVLADTNILLIYVQPGHPMHPRAMSALARIGRQGDRVVVASQNLAEFWTVATRPTGSLNGLGYTPAEAKTEIDGLVTVFARLPDADAAFPIWLDLVERYGVSGKTTHDARIVATMLANGVTRVLTFNDTDFVRFTEITVEVL